MQCDSWGPHAWAMGEEGFVGVPPSVSALPSARQSSRAGKVVMGTCGWSDPGLVKCGRFYPCTVKVSTPSDAKLPFYASRFPCVEVDTSTYAIPSAQRAAKWADAAPAGFVFHVKAYGLFASRSIRRSSLPWHVRETLHPGGNPDAHIRLDDLDPGAVERTWADFNACCAAFADRGKLGCVVFQWPLRGFPPCEKSWAHVAWCRRHLDPRYAMACEFRDRAWFAGAAGQGQQEQEEGAGGGRVQDVADRLTNIGAVLVAADELHGETLGGESSERLHVALGATNPQVGVYVRVHRRRGSERVLRDEEVAWWAEQLAQIGPTLQGPIYFLWGTDHEDQPWVNAKRLADACGRERALDWAAEMRQADASRPGSIASFLSRPGPRNAPDKKNTTDRDAPSTEPTQGERPRDATPEPARKRAKKVDITHFFKPA